MAIQTRSTEMTSPSTLVRLMTADDYRLMPETNQIRELINGELVMAPAPRQKHQWVAGRLFRLIDDHLTKDDLGIVHFAPFDVYLGTHEVYQPDIVVVLWTNPSQLTQMGLQGAPDLVIEILSPSNRKQDLVTKAVEYAQFGVPEYWIVDPSADRIEVYRLEHGTYVAEASTDGVGRSVILPGLEVIPASIFTLPKQMTKPAQPDEES